MNAGNVALVLRVVEPIWLTKFVTAGRVRSRIEQVLDWCKVRGYRTGDNPAKWDGHLDQLLPVGGDIGVVTHHKAMAYASQQQGGNDKPSLWPIVRVIGAIRQ
jgi:hypothetical protein